MNDEEMTLGLFIKFLAKYSSILAVLFIVMISFNKGHIPQSPSMDDLGLFLCFPVGVSTGLLLALKYEGIGGLVTITSIVIFYAFNSYLWGNYPDESYYLILSFPSVLSLLSCLLNDPDFSNR